MCLGVTGRSRTGTRGFTAHSSAIELRPHPSTRDGLTQGNSPRLCPAVEHIALIRVGQPVRKSANLDRATLLVDLDRQQAVDAVLRASPKRPDRSVTGNALGRARRHAMAHRPALHHQVLGLLQLTNHEAFALGPGLVGRGRPLPVTVLAGMSGGNFFGGSVADRFASRRTLGLIFVAGSIATLGILVVTHAIEGVTFGLSFLPRIVASIALIFFVPSFVLGMVSPFVVKLALADLQRSGRTVGTIYAASTVGSIVEVEASLPWPERSRRQTRRAQGRSEDRPLRAR